ncbi:unnamed protein product [Brachionus calyciflorus]|uniref:BEN domain-containing protein n=1 Tax=Brachionus calyciflorus TaxID=104777 RepID=A0A814GWF9_9BILA|nr:unnamed protein product [Brachionus calyciflorus]
MSIEQKDEVYVVMFFEEDNTNVVMEKDKLIGYDVQENSAMVYFPKSKKLYSGKIKKEGSKKKCEKKCKKLIDSQKTDVSSTEDDNRTTEDTDKSSKAKYEEQTSSLTIYLQEVKKLKLEFDEIKSTLVDIKNTLSELVQNQTRLPPPESEKKKIMYNDKNLVDVSASSTVKYVTQCMEILFTKEQTLDITKIELLRDAFFVKYNIAVSNQDETYEWIKNKAKRKCLDTNLNDE